jgi:NAD(P)-dependent dehydrogenase (short-subunit alcohol dehydrogenase family)
MGVDSGIALVTGASRGIGRAVAVELARRGLDVVGTVRRASDGAALAELGDGRIEAVIMDVTDPTTYTVPDGLRVLVNNAGTDGDHVPVEHADIDAWRTIFDANLFGMVSLSRAAIPTLRANAPSVIATITSSSILMPVPFYAAYRASKAAASAVCDSLRTELAPLGVRVVEILPGPVATDMFEHSKREPEAAQFEVYRAMAERGAETRKVTADPMVESAEAAAVAIVDAVLADGGPMRYSCDPLGRGLLDMWRTSDDEALYRMMASGYDR